MSSSPTQVAGSAAPRVTNEEVRAVLHTHIHKTAKFIKFLDLCVHLFAWIASMFGLWLLACVVDHWLVPLSSVGRWLVWIVAVAGTAWWLVTKLVPLLVRRINPAYAAKRIEHLLPEFKNGLISWLELDQMQENGVPRGIMSALTYRAARFIGGQDPSTTVDTSRLIKLIGVVLLLFTSLVVYTMVSPKSVMDTGKRIAMPWRSIAVPSRVKIVSVNPGAVELTQGKPLDVEVEVRGIRTKEAVQVRFTTTDGQLRDQRVDLTAVSEGFRYAGKVRTETTGVEHELDYWVEAGDAVSGPYRVTLSPLPSVVLDQVELKFPAYTKIPDRKVSGGDFEAIEGTKATIRALGNQKMSRGRWEINPEIDAAGELVRADSVLELSVDDRQLSGTLLLQLNSEKDNPTQLSYRLRGFNQRGDGNREPILHSMKVIADVGPEIKLVGPENRRLKVRPTSRFNLEVQANDPDFGLSHIELEIRRSGIVVRKETLLKSEGAIGQQIKRLPINMADFRLAEGGKLEVRATAYDNRHDPISEKLAPNSKESELLTLEVVGPDQEVAPDEEPAPTSNEDTASGAQSEKNDTAGNESAGRGNQGADDRGASTNDPNAAEPARNNANDSSQEPRQNSTPNPASPNGSGDQGEEQGKQGAQDKQEGQQGKQEADQGKQQSKSSDGKAEGKQQSGQPGGQQSGAGKQEASKQEPGQDSQGQGSQSGSSSSSDGSQQPDTNSGSSSRNASQKPSNSQGSNSQGSNSQGSNSQGSNSLGSKSSSPNSNAAKGDAGEKSQAGKGQDSQASPDSGSGEGNKPSDGEVVKRVQDYMQENNPKPEADPNSAQKNNPSNENGSTADANSQGTQGEGNSKNSQNDSKNNSKSDPQNNSKNDRTGSQDSKSDSSNSIGQPSSQRNSENQSKPTDPSGKGDSQSQKPQSQNQGSGENSQDKGADDKGADDRDSGDKGADGNETSDGKNSENSSGSSKNSNGEGSDGKGADGKDADGKGSGSKGADGKGANGQGSDQKSPDGKGGDSKGAGSQGSGSKGADSKGADSKGAGSQGSGSQGSGSQGSGSKGGDSKGGDSKGSDSKGGDSKGGDSKGADAKGADSKGADSKGADSKGADSKGADSQGADSKGADSKGADSKGADSKGADSKGGPSGGSQAGKPSGSGTGGGKANGSKSGKSGTSGSGTGNGEGGGEGKADEANQDYANRTTQMVLDYLNRQREQPDPELLRELNWTEDDLRKFTERWNKARNLAVSPNPEDQKKWKEMLDDLGLERQLAKPSAAGSIDDNFQQMRDSGNRTRPPENLRKQYEAFRRAFEKSGK